MSRGNLNLVKRLEPQIARRKLIRLLQHAHAGEGAAALAYKGHYLSLFVTDKVEKKENRQICLDEIHHRSELKLMLSTLNAKPNVLREMLMFTIGICIGFYCLWGGWFIPMYGAGKLECTNVVEYENAARLAYLSGQHEMIEKLLEFAEIEWDHEFYFRQKSGQHWLYRFFPKWSVPPPRELIRSDFEAYPKLLSRLAG